MGSVERSAQESAVERRERSGGGAREREEKGELSGFAQSRMSINEKGQLGAMGRTSSISCVLAEASEQRITVTQILMSTLPTRAIAHAYITEHDLQNILNRAVNACVHAAASPIRSASSSST